MPREHLRRCEAVQGGARAHMSQQHEIVSQMSRFVSLKSARAEPMFPSAQESRRLYARPACSGEMDALASVRLVGSAGRDEEAQQVGGHANPEVHHRAIEDCARHCTPARGDAWRALSDDAHGPEKFVVPEGVGAHTRTRLTAAQADGGTRIPPRRDRGGAAAHLLRKAAEAQQTGVGVMTCQETRAKSADGRWWPSPLGGSSDSCRHGLRWSRLLQPQQQQPSPSPRRPTRSTARVTAGIASGSTKSWRSILPL